MSDGPHYHVKDGQFIDDTSWGPTFKCDKCGCVVGLWNDTGCNVWLGKDTPLEYRISYCPNCGLRVFSGDLFDEPEVYRKARKWREEHL